MLANLDLAGDGVGDERRSVFMEFTYGDLHGTHRIVNHLGGSTNRFHDRQLLMLWG
jgi:hypothetical protein